MTNSYAKAHKQTGVAKMSTDAELRSERQPDVRGQGHQRVRRGPVSETITIEHRGRSYEIATFVRPGARKPLLYLHGLGSTKEDFLSAARVPQLADRTLVSFDFPGCGRSSIYHPEIPLGIDDLATLTHAVARRLDLGEVTLIGQSLGGLTGLQVSRRYPELVARFINVEGNLAPEDCEIQSRDVFRHRFLGDEDRFFERVRDRLGSAGGAVLDAFVASMRDNIVDRAYFDYCRSIVDYSDNFALLDEFAALPMPRMFIHGSDNANLSYLPGLESAGIPVVSVPHSGHFPAASNPDYYYEAIARFIGTNGSAPSRPRAGSL